MSTLCTAFPSSPSEGHIPLNTLKNCAKTTAKNNVQEIIHIDELRPSWRSHLEFYAFSSQPPTESVVTRVVGVAYLPLFRLYLSHPYLPIGQRPRGP
jgi:hypothetical protein